MNRLTTFSAIGQCDSPSELLAELRECVQSWAGNVARMAAIVRRLDQLGVEVSIENSMLPYIRLIAHGQLSAAAFTNLMHDQPLLDRIARLPLPLQERAADNQPFKVMEANGDHRMVRPLDMTARERRQVFAGKRLRTDAEQVGWIKEQAAKDSSKRIITEERPVSLDRRRGGIVVSGLFIPLAELAGYVAALSR